MNLFIVSVIFIVCFVLIASGFGVAFFFLLRKRKPVWVAKIYQRKGSNFKKGDLELSDLEFVGSDTLSKTELEEGTTVYLLQSLNRTTPEPTARSTFRDDGGKRFVKVLYENDSCTLLEEGYDSKTGSVVFSPLNYERTNMIMNNLSAKKKRFEEEKSLIEKITPFIIFGIAMLGVVAVAYIFGQAWIKISENNLAASDLQVEGQLKITQLFIDAQKEIAVGLDGRMGELQGEINDLEEVLKSSPPSIE